MKELLKKLKVVQEVSNEQRHKAGLKRLGKGYFKAYRLNPFNPLSYMLVVITIPVIITMYGFIGAYEKAMNPFKWY
jgi:membrane protein insertase Oxa1/YidC/SpoIIIJ